MLLEYSIENTFSIKEKQTISFEAVIDDKDSDEFHCKQIGDKRILKMACLYGANASGKTKMAKALFFYIDFILSSFTDLRPNESTHFVPFKFSEETRQSCGSFELIFYAKDLVSDKIVKYKYNLSLNEKSVEQESLYYAPKGQMKLLFERNSTEEIKWGIDVTGAKKIIAEMTRTNCSVISAGAQAKHPIFKFIYEYLSERFNGIITSSSGGLSGYIAKKLETDSELKQKVLLLLSVSDIGNITDIKVKSEPIPDELIAQFPQNVQEEIAKGPEKPKSRNLSIVHSYDKEYELSLNEESEGTKRLMELSLPLIDISTSDSLLIIDELESSLHQLLLETFIQAFLMISTKTNSESQLLFTTHNQELLDSGLLRDDEVWFCYKDFDGASIYNCITDFTGVRKEVSRKRLYQSGKFGALPNLDINTLVEKFSAKKNS